MNFQAALATFACTSVLLHAADPFAENVRTTDPLPAEEQLETFKLPPGFEIQLVASEPDIQKPMNMAFDARGRLWVSMSREYPYPAPLDKPARDSIRILEDFDKTGRARKITTFADGLNIPIGLYPYKNGVIAWSIPNIWYFEDTDGDDKADKKEVLFGPLGWERDTHGNQASFRRGFDGWLYITHGYNNISTIRGKDGSSIQLHSGNTYRVRLDGSRVEPHTWGQVNPFGLAFDPQGNMYSADCHSAPIYELLRGGVYPSFGKPHDGLGFAPTLMEHSHGSTAICGIIHCSDDSWPEEFQNNIFIGNVMTSRINRDRLTSEGSSKTAHELPDFLTTTDPWFRPVDIQHGPDGALYVADFYNRIIGHYEVPLTHPGRDRERARIWRVVYNGNTEKAPDLTTFSADDLIVDFAHGNLTRRMLALNELVDRFGTTALIALERAVESPKNSNQLIQCLWALHRIQKLSDETIAQAEQHENANVRIHAMRILSEIPAWSEQRQALAIACLKDKDATVQRAAADALAQHPREIGQVKPLLKRLHKVPAEDDHLRHTVRMSLRNQLRTGYPFTSEPSADSPKGVKGPFVDNISEKDARAIADVSLGVQTEQAAAFLFAFMKKWEVEPAALTEYVRHTARYIPEHLVGNLGQFIQERFEERTDEQLSFFRAIQEGSSQRGLTLSPEVRSWGIELAQDLLKDSSTMQAWNNFPVPGKPLSPNPWFLQERVSQDGESATFICSLPPGGERFTGILRSKTFTLPSKLTFWLAGHDGSPAGKPLNNNYVQLVMWDTSTPGFKTRPPRNDTAQRIEWDLSSVAGKNGYIEVVDGDTGDAYAWLAVGRFEPPVIAMPGEDPNQNSQQIKAAAELARSLQARELAPTLQKLLADETVDYDARATLAEAVVFFSPNEQRAALATLVAEPAIDHSLREGICQGLAQSDKVDSETMLVDAMRRIPTRVQAKVAQSLAGSPKGAETLLNLIEKGEGSPYLLLDPNIKNKFTAFSSGTLQERYAKLTKDLAPADQVAQKAIEEQVRSYDAGKADLSKGANVFTQSCASCHQVDGNGALVGPQLDGIGNRGLERILEDLLDPNRNVDINFRTEILVLKDSDVVTGLPRREEGDLLILADSTGKEVSIPKANIERRRTSETSLMPSNFGDVLSQEDLQNLVAFLLSKKAEPAK